MICRLAKRHPYLLWTITLSIAAFAVFVAWNWSAVWAMRRGLSRCWWLSESCVVDWSAWAAIGTFLAVVVAIALGVLPLMLGRRELKARVRALAQIACDDLSIQVLHVSAAILIARSDGWGVAKQKRAVGLVAALDAKAVNALVPYAVAFPTHVIDAIADCSANIANSARRDGLIASISGETFDGEGWAGWYDDLVPKMDGLRRSLATWAGAPEPDDFAPYAQVLADGLCAEAEEEERRAQGQGPVTMS